MNLTEEKNHILDSLEAINEMNYSNTLNYIVMLGKDSIIVLSLNSLSREFDIHLNIFFSHNKVKMFTIEDRTYLYDDYILFNLKRGQK